MPAAARAYTRAELLSLRALPDTARYFRRPRQSVGYLFANGKGRGSVLIDTNSHAPGSLVSHAHAFLPVLRYGRGLSSLNLHPSSARDVAINELLWRSAQRGEYDATVGDSLLRANVLALVMSAELLAFLRRVTLAELRECVLEVLALIAEDELADGLALMASEVEPETWNALQLRLAAWGTRCPARTSRDVEALLRMCCLSPWKVDVYAAYVTPHDMQAAIAAAEQPPAPEAPHMLARVRARAPSKNVVYWKLFMDWQLYRRLWVERLGIHPADAVKTMMTAITTGRQEEAWRRVETLRLCCSRPKQKGNWLAVLPKDVLYNIVAPQLLFVECGGT